jgi:thiamine-phosphate pyrophosphorylase
MMSDERMGKAFLPALARMPKGSGLIFRHYGLASAERRTLFERARRIARARRIVLVLAGSTKQAHAWRADGVHGGDRIRSPAMFLLILSKPVHNVRELIAAERAGADLVFISPVFATRSHPGGRALARRGFAALARQSKIPVIALGGLNKRRARMLGGAYGWAGIDAWL